MRNAQDRQTIGIPVGPETSRIVAEIVACAIDVELAKHVRSAKIRAFRFVDDYAIGVESLDEVERMKASLRRCLHDYELEINDEKTFSREVLHLEYASWRQRIRSNVPSPHAAAGQWHSYFDLIRSIASEASGENIQLYALKRARESMVNAAQWKDVETFLLLSYRTNKTLLPVICSILINRHSSRSDVDLARIKSFIQINIDRLHEGDKHLEIAWMLFLAKALKIALGKRVVEPLTSMQSSVCALILCDLEENALVSPLNKQSWNQSANIAGLASPMWLYSYESCRLNWNGLSDNYVAKDPYFSEFVSRNIAFYDKGKNVRRHTRDSRLDLIKALKMKLARNEEMPEVSDPTVSFPAASFDEYDDYLDSDFY